MTITPARISALRTLAESASTGDASMTFFTNFINPRTVLEMLDEVERLRAQLEWRAVDEDTPKDGSQYLAYFPYRQHGDTFQCAKHVYADPCPFSGEDKIGGVWSADGRECDDPVLWLPIPALPPSQAE